MSNVDKLRALIDTRYAGSQAAFARAIARSGSQVNQWLSGHRRLDLKGEQIIEKALGIAGYFSDGTQTAAPSLQQSAAAYHVDISDDERELILALRVLRPARAALLRAQVFDELDREKPDSTGKTPPII